MQFQFALERTQKSMLIKTTALQELYVRFSPQALSPSPHTSINALNKSLDA